ncbi:MAG: hypothetical protein JRC99_08480 [Deltaproteobacteria bacterium]|nr:hypothetical protein [Deltaproteobacteria bacterium]
MFKKELFTSILVAFFCVGLVGTALAGEVIYDGSEAGSDEFTFDAPTEVNDAAKNHVYNEESLAIIGTEAGDWEFKYDAPETKADVAARNYNYNQESLASIGTEAGNDEFRFDASERNVYGSAPNEAVADGSEIKDVICNGC